MKIRNREQIKKRREEIGRELEKLLKKTRSDFKINDIREIIYNEDGSEGLAKIISIFDTGQGLIELENMIQIINDAWNYFPHKVLGDISPAEKMLEYEGESDKKTTNESIKKGQKLTKKQKDLLWSGGGKSPYSQVNLIKQVRILDDSVSRIFLVVEAEINPTTFKIVESSRDDYEFKDDVMIQQFLDRAEYRGPQFGYIVAAFEEEYRSDEIMIKAEYALKYTQENVIKMHKYVLNNFKLD